MPVVRRASRGIVAPRVPECTVINRIDRHLAVVSEEEVIVLDATAVNEGQLTTRQSAQRIGRLPARVVDRGIYAGARNVESYGDIPVPVHRHTPKPPIIGIGRIGPLLINFPRAPGSPSCPHAKLVPADARVIMRRVAVSSDGMVEQQRLIRAEIAVLQRLHHVALSKRIESLPNSRLLDTELVLADIGVEHCGTRLCVGTSVEDEGKSQSTWNS